MNTYEIKCDLHSNDDLYEELEGMCKSALEKISVISPSDNDVNLTVDKDDEDFVVVIRMSSYSLVLSCREMARSPFMAIESATKSAIHKVQKWSAMRKFN